MQMTYTQLQVKLKVLNMKIAKEEKQFKREAKKKVKALIKEFGIKRNQVFNAKGKAIKVKQ